MKKNVFCLFVLALATFAYAVEFERVPEKSRSQEIVDVFVKTPVDKLPGETDRVRAWILSKQAPEARLSKISAAVEARVRKAAADDDELEFRLSEVRRCFAAEEISGPSDGYGHNREDSGNWRLLIGGFARGGAKMRDARCGSGSRSELYGYEIDLQYNVWKSSWHNLWLSVGFASAPKQGVGSAGSSTTDATGTTTYRGSDLDAEYYELRLMLIPEFRIFERLTIGPRVGVAFDWTTISGSYHAGMRNPLYPVVNRYRSASYDEQELFVQGIIGAQMTWRFLRYMGIYASIDYRGGGKASFTKNSTVDKGEVDFSMDGWQASCGLFGEF